MATIENVNDRTILQQFHSLYKAVEEIKNKGINLNVKGQYESETTYLKGDVVYNDGKAFYRINDDATTGVDTSNTEYWQMFFDAVTGLQGQQGQQGSPGWGFNNATIIDFLNDAINVDDNGIYLSQTMQVTAQQQIGSNPPSASIFEIETSSNIPIVGSDTIVVDLDEQGEKVEIHVDAEITNKLARTLVTPLSAHRETEIVAVDNTNSQTMLAIGDGLSVENGTLKASGGSSSSKLYKHMLTLRTSSGIDYIRNYVFIFTSTSDVFTTESLVAWLNERNIKSEATALSPIFTLGYQSIYDGKILMPRALYTDGTSLKLTRVPLTITSTLSDTTITSNFVEQSGAIVNATVLTDKVIEL